MLQFELRGLDATIARLKDLPNTVRKKVVMGAASKAARVVTNAAKENALRIDDPGTGRRISANIQQRFASKLYKSTGDVGYRVGVATPKGRIPKGNPDEGLKGPTPHWHLIELGREGVEAKPFMLPALSANVDKVIAVFGAEAAKRLDKLT